MVDIVITSVEDLLDKLNVFPDIDFFRGHSSIEYKLIPSIGQIELSPLYYKDGTKSLQWDYQASMLQR